MEPVQKAKRYLSVYRELKKRLDRAGSDIEQLIGDPANKERIAFIQNKIREWLELCYEIEDTVNRLPALEKTVIRYRYLLNIPWADICEIIYDDPELISTVHRRALNRIYESIK